MLTDIISTFHAQLLIPLTPEAEAKIIGGFKTPITSDTTNNPTNIGIDKASAKIRIELGKVSPNQTFSNKFGTCTSYFDELTGQLRFSCTLNCCSE
ncbi:MAG: hypothetical protein ACRAVC_02010 [Trichormus sp.]